MNVKPMGSKLLVKLIEEDNVSAGGIIIPDTAKKGSTKATIINMGDEVETLGITDTVIISKYAGSNVKYENIEYLVIEEDDVLALIEKEIV